MLRSGVDAVNVVSRERPGLLGSEAEYPGRLHKGREVTVDDVRRLLGASTPHFAVQLRERIRNLIRGLPPDHLAQIKAECEIVPFDELAFAGEVRGHPAGPGLAAFRSLEPQGGNSE